MNVAVGAIELAIARITRRRPDRDRKGPKGNPKAQQVHVGGHRSRIMALLGGVQMECQLDRSADINILRVDAYLSIAQKNSELAIEKRERSLTGARGLLNILGAVRISIVIEEATLLKKMLIGDPLLDLANIQLGKEGVEVMPLVGHAYVQHIKAEVEDVIGPITENLEDYYIQAVRKFIEGYEPEEAGPAATLVQMWVRLKDQ